MEAEGAVSRLQLTVWFPMVLATDQPAWPVAKTRSCLSHSLACLLRLEQSNDGKQIEDDATAAD